MEESLCSTLRELKLFNYQLKHQIEDIMNSDRKRKRQWKKRADGNIWGQAEGRWEYMGAGRGKRGMYRGREREEGNVWGQGEGTGECRGVGRGKG